MSERLDDLIANLSRQVHVACQSAENDPPELQKHVDPTDVEDLLEEVMLLKGREAALRAAGEKQRGLMLEVYLQAGNGAPAHRRHALTPGLRDDIRDLIYPQNAATEKT